MSSVVKGIKKVFKKVVDVVKKIAVPALMVGALVFTGGASLGLNSILGGWGSAVTAVTTKLGAKGVLGSVISGAITQAGKGAVIGGAVSAATGGSFSEGAKAGAVGGAVTGGLLGATSALRAPIAAPTGAEQATNAVGQPTSQAAGATIDGATGRVIEEAATGAMGPPVSRAGAAISSSAGSGGLLSRAGNFIRSNPELVGNIMKGVGAGLSAGAEADAERDLLRERQRLISRNYRGVDPGRNYREASPGRSTQSPTERFGSFEYQYNPSSGRIERVPVGG